MKEGNKLCRRFCKAKYPVIKYKVYTSFKKIRNQIKKKEIDFSEKEYYSKYFGQYKSNSFKI